MGETLLLIGTGMQAGSKFAKGSMAKEAGEYEAGGLRRAATEEVAAGQRARFEKDAETRQVLSSQRALAASSGAGATAPTILDIMGDTAERGKYLADMETYKAESRAAGLKDKANAAELRGKQAYVGSILEGVSDGVTGLYKFKKATGSGKAGYDPSWSDTRTYRYG